MSTIVVPDGAFACATKCTELLTVLPAVGELTVTTDELEGDVGGGVGEVGGGVGVTVWPTVIVILEV